jgi:glycosyltransferase involved in cell wall biosynthesis
VIAGLTAVIAARNEASNIVACIDSVRWAREVIVVENDSTDDTADLARRAGATVMYNPFATIGGQRNAAIERASTEWILVVDADERGSNELAAEIESVIAAPAHDAYRVPRRNYFLGSEVRHGGWDRDKPVRLFRKKLRYSASRVHEHVETNTPPGELRAALMHAPYASIDQYFEKLDRYSRWWAEDRHERGGRAGAATVVLRPPFRFLSMYLLRGGFLDGARGAVLACMAATSVMAKYARLWALGRDSNRR